MPLDTIWTTEWYTDESGNKTTQSVTGEVHTVIDSRFILDGIPDPVTKVTITSPADMVEIKQWQTISSASQYKVDYNSGIVQVYSSLEATPVTCNYASRGVKRLSSTSVYVDGDGDVDLQTKIETIESNISTGDGEYDAHVAGTADKHNSSDIVNDSNVSGTNVDDALNTIDTRMDNHVAGTTEKHGSDEITNDSTVTGAYVSDALETVQSQIDALEVGDSNALIGIYSINASGTDTLTGTYTDLTYFTGLKINLMIANDNTGAVTFNLNSLGAKSVYKIVKGVKTELSPRDLREGEIAVIEDDGTDFILLNGEREAEYSTDTNTTDTITDIPSSAIEGGFEKMEVDGRLVVNLLSDDVAGCEATTGWTTVRSAVSIDSSNELEGTICLKITISAGETDGNIYRNILPLLDTTKYYLISAHIKNGSATNIQLKCDFSGGIGIIAPNAVTSTAYTRVGFVVQPTDFGGASEANLYPIVTGSETQYGFVDAIQINEISSADYTAEADPANASQALLDKYQYHRGIKPVDKMRVLSEGKNLFDKHSPNIIYGKSLSYLNGSISTNESAFISDYIKIEPSRTYIKNIGTGYLFYDSKKSFISGISSSVGATAPNNAEYLRYSNLISDIDNIQLEKGSTATTYEPYKSSQSVCPVELRDVPAGTADSWNAKTGEVVKRIGYESVAHTSTVSSYTNFDIHTYNFDMTTVKQSGSIIVDGIEYTYQFADTDSTDSIRTWNANGGNTALRIRVPKAESAADPIEFYYQLVASEYTTTYYPASVVQSYPSGRFIQEPYIEEQVQYSTNITILDSNYPIANLVYVNKIDIATGTLTQVPLSDCTVAAGGGSFTISTASAGEWYDYGYNYNFLSTNGSVEYSHNTNLKAQVSNNTQDINELSRQVGNLQKVNPVSEIGTVTLTNSLTYPFNDSQDTVSLDYVRTSTNYIVTTEITSVTGDDAGDIVISDKATNGFKIEFTGSATSVTVTYVVQEVL